MSEPINVVSTDCTKGYVLSPGANVVSTDCTRAFVSSPGANSVEHHSCPECGRPMKVCAYCEIGKVVESAPPPEVRE